MAHDADANRTSKRWLWLLLLPWIAMIWRSEEHTSELQSP